MVPLPPHDPREREVVAVAASWHVLQFPPVDPKLAYFASRGFLHLQLWQPETRWSILTPSRLTAGNFEARPVGGERIATRSWAALAAALAAHDVLVPGAAEVRALERWLVMRRETPQLRLLRTWWAAPVTC